jgi:hypothetical protein
VSKSPNELGFHVPRPNAAGALTGVNLRELGIVCHPTKAMINTFPEMAITQLLDK